MVADTDLVLLPLEMDLRQENGGPTTTLASFTVWNESSQMFSGAKRCVTVWDESLLSAYGAPNHFLLANLATPGGRAEISGLADAGCTGPNPSTSVGLLGVASRMVAFSGGTTGVGLGGRSLAGTGTQSATIRIDIIEPPGELTRAAPAERLSAGVPDEPVRLNGAGSVLLFPAVEVKWNASGEVVEDTFLELSNTVGAPVLIRFQLMNGDPPVDAVYAGEPPMLIIEAEPGWNSACCQIPLLANQPTIWSAATGAATCGPFSLLDPASDESNRPGRPNPEGGGRVLRGYVLAWAVAADGGEISWNHLTGGITHVNYQQVYIWEHGPYAVPAVAGSDGSPPDGIPGQILLDGVEYGHAFAAQHLSFHASGSTALSNGGTFAIVDSDLTLLASQVDITDAATGPVTSRAEFSVYNENSQSRSGMGRCVVGFDQTPASQYQSPNHFLSGNLGTDTGKATISGTAGASCQDAVTSALFGASNMLLTFSGGASGTCGTGITIAGSGTYSTASILFDARPNCGRLYVDVDAAGTADGLTWANAYTHLQAALAAATSGMEIWVAEGTYMPDGGRTPEGGSHVNGSGSRTATFDLLDGVKLYGGFAGIETLLSERDPAANRTILSGDLSANDGPSFSNNGENSLHVLTADTFASPARVDGFEIVGGNANVMSGLNDIGGGLLVLDAPVVLENCKFTNNAAVGPGAAVVVSPAPAQLSVIDCTFSDNASPTIGGAAIHTLANTAVSGSLFERNEGGQGGALLVAGGAVLDVDRSQFRQNTATTTGGAISSGTGAVLRIRRSAFLNNIARAGGAIEHTDDKGPGRYESCVFAGNVANDGTGGAVYIDSASPVFGNCTFVANSATEGGGAIDAQASAFGSVNCTLYGNTAVAGAGGMQFDSFQNPVVTNSILWSNSGSGSTEEQQILSLGIGVPELNYSIVQGLSGALGGSGNLGADPEFADPNGADDAIGTLDDDLRLRPGSPATDAGNTTALPADSFDFDEDLDVLEYVPFDVAGNHRQFDDPATADTGIPGSPVVDIGALEFFTDCNNNGVLDSTDIATGESQDCSSPSWPANGIPDSCDIAACPGDPDCDDCNLNGVPDACDIQAGVSQDADLPLGIPDECIAPLEGVNWSDDIWSLAAPDPYPDNLNPNAVPGLHVSLPSGLDLLLDVTVEIDSLRLQNGSTLRVTQSGAGDLSIAPPGNLQLGGTLLVANDRSIAVPGGDVTIVPGGKYLADDAALARMKGAGGVSAAMSTTNLDMTFSACESPACIDGGAVCLSQDMQVIVEADLRIDGRLAADADCGMSDLVCGASPAARRAGGYTPPILRAVGRSIVFVSANLSIQGSGELVLDPATPASTPLTLGGDFKNESTNPSCFQVSTGGFLLNGAGTQVFEAASTDVGETGDRGGATANFAIGAIEVTAGTEENPHVVIFHDSFDNNAQGQGSCEEAVYVGALLLGAHSQVILDNCRVYAETLLAHSTADVQLLGCATLIGIPVEPDAVASEPGGMNKGRAASIVVPPPAANRSQAAVSTGLRVTLTTLNHPRLCCTDATGGSCSATLCDVDAHCSGVPGGNQTCAHRAAPGTPNFSAFEGKTRYANSFAIGKCCDPGSAGQAACNFAANCTGDGDCVPPNASQPFTSCNRLICQDDGPPFNTSYKCATLGCEPEYRDWAADLAVPGTGQPAVPGLLFINGDALVPSSTVAVSQILATCGPAASANTCPEASAPLVVGTARWGDITGPGFSAPDGKSDVLDIPAIVNKLKNIPTGDPVYPFPEHRLWLKQRDPAPNLDAITVIDLSDAVDAGPQGKPYPASRTIDACSHD